MAQQKYVTPRCIICGNTSVLMLDSEGLEQFKRGVFVQKAFPKLNPSEREHVLTGTHPACWNKVMGDE